MAVAKVTLNGTTLIDVSEDTVTPSTLASGYTAKAANGESVTGTFEQVTYELEQSGNTVTLSGSDESSSSVSVAPTSHASTATTYGVGTANNYGHLKLSDSTSSTSSTSGGIAATPAAVKAVMDAIPTVPSASTTTPNMDGTASYGSGTTWARADHVHPTDTSRAPTSHASTATTYGAGTASNYGHLKLSDSTSSTSSTSDGTAATPAAVKAAYDLADGKQDAITQGSITTTTTWSGSGPYTQTVTVSSATTTSASKVDIQPDATAIAQMIEDGVQALYVANNNGTLTMYAIGAAPTASLTIQCTVTEVS